MHTGCYSGCVRTGVTNFTCAIVFNTVVCFFLHKLALNSRLALHRIATKDVKVNRPADREIGVRTRARNAQREAERVNHYHVSSNKIMQGQNVLIFVMERTATACTVAKKHFLNNFSTH